MKRCIPFGDVAPVFSYIVAVVAVCNSAAAQSSVLTATLSDDGNEVRVVRAGSTTPIVTQVAKADFRPFVHPIVAPDGNGVMTEYSPGHHRHQTGLYWGFTRVNGRDYFHNPCNGFWKRVSVPVLKESASGGEDSVQWQTVYDLLDENGAAKP